MICIRLATLLVPLLLLPSCADEADGQATPGARPTAIFVHGGGWRAGSPASGRPLADFFDRRGFTFRSIDYPKPPAATLSDGINAIDREIDEARRSGAVTVIGHSAGAHLAAAAAFRGDAADTGCLILLDGIGYDLVRTLTDNPALVDRTMLKPRDAAPVSPLALIAKSPRRPAVYLAAGGDWRGTADQATAFAAALRGQGFDVTLAIMPELDHSGFLRDFSDPATALARSVSAFLDAHPRCSGLPG